MTRAALHTIEQTHDYNFLYVALVKELGHGTRIYPAYDRLSDSSSYNTDAVPTCFFDGGDNLLVGGFSDTASYTSLIRASGTRAVYPLDLRVATQPIGGNDYEVLIRIGNNQAANIAPILTGPITGPGGGEPNTVYSFSISATDSDSEVGLFYQWDWGDGSLSSWVGPLDTGVVHQASHSWTGGHIYQVKVRAKDIFDDATDWSDSLALSILNTSAGDPGAENDLPSDYLLAQNHPNPFNPSTTIEYFLPRRSEVLLSIHNLLGQTIATLVDGSQAAGTHLAVWDGIDSEGKTVASGIYFYKLETGSFTQSHKMVLLK